MFFNKVLFTYLKKKIMVTNAELEYKFKVYSQVYEETSIQKSVRRNIKEYELIVWKGVFNRSKIRRFVYYARSFG